MDTPAHKPPASASNEAEPGQLAVASTEGDAYRQALHAMQEESGAVIKHAGDYVVALVQEDAEGMYALEHGRLVWCEAPQEANGHLEVAVADAGDGRFVPGLTIAVTVHDKDRPLFTTVMPFLWHPFLHHYGSNIRFPGDARYDVEIRIDPPGFMRHDPVNGKRYGEPVTVLFSDVPFRGGRKPSPEAEPRAAATPYADYERETDRTR